MPIATSIKATIGASSWIRKMFEEGARLKAVHGEREVFDFSLGNPDLEPPLEFSRKLTELAQETRLGTHGYMPNAGYLETRAAMARKVQREHRVAIGAEHVVMCVGAAGGLNVVLKTILNPGDEVLVIRPYFVEYGAYVSNHGGVLRVVDPEADFGISVDNIAAALGPKTAAVIVNSPNNPCGKLYPEASIQALGDALEAEARRTGRRTMLLVDEPYRDLVYGGKVAPPIACHYRDTIVVNSFSKSLSLAGERIGYIAVAPTCDEVDDLVAGIVMCNRTLGFVNAPALMQRAVTTLEHVTIDISPYERRRDQLAAGLRAAGIEFCDPDGAFYLFCKSPDPDDVKFVQHLKEHRILAVPGQGFGYPGWFRLSYAVPDWAVQGGVARFRDAMNAWRALCA
ncbi:MAG TPA: pyridoxal phosphate-dependent aminotransferase [Polyangiaceae bacterium]